MQIKPRSYPHPVLSHFGDDIIDSLFQPVVTVKGAKNAYMFDAVFKTNNEDLLALVAHGKAFYAVHVECTQTRYRNIFTSTSEKFAFEIGAGLLDGRVEVCSFMLAAKSIAKYKNSNFHSDYETLTFRVRKGDTLAVGLDREFPAEKKDDPLRKVPSIFSIVQNDDPEATGIDIDAGGPKVIVRLSKGNFDSYMFLRQSQALHPVLSASVIFPALVDVIEKIRRASMDGALDAYSELRWFIVIARRLRELNINPYDPDSFVDSSLKIAHELIGQPVSPSLEALKSMIEEDSE
jgi:hypothetical protein